MRIIISHEICSVMLIKKKEERKSYTQQVFADLKYKYLYLLFIQCVQNNNYR